VILSRAELLKKSSLITVILVSGLIIYLYPIQDEKMKNTFYYNWLAIGNPKNFYAEKYDIIEFKSTSIISENMEVDIRAGYSCKFANQLRNSNLYLDFDNKKKPAISVKKVTDFLTRSIYNCSENFLVEHRSTWILYNSKVTEKITSGMWDNNGSTFFCYIDGFQFFDNVLQRYNLKGQLLNNYHLFGGSDLNHHDIVYLNDYIISAGYLSQNAFAGDGLPGNLKPAGQLESFKLTNELKTPNPDENLSPDNPNLLAFIQEEPLIPVYLTDFIIQALINKIVITDYDLKIQKVIEGEFIPLAISSDKDSRIYMVALFDEEIKLLSFDINGNLFFSSKLEISSSKRFYPPSIASDGSIYIVSEYSIVAVSPSGEQLWTRFFNNPQQKEVYPILYNNILIITYDKTITAFSSTGDTLFNFIDIPIGINTPLISNKENNYFVGTDSGIFEITFN
jgi:hypothetical protein